MLAFRWFSRYSTGRGLCRQQVQWHRRRASEVTREIARMANRQRRKVIYLQEVSVCWLAIAREQAVQRWALENAEQR